MNGRKRAPLGARLAGVGPFFHTREEGRPPTKHRRRAGHLPVPPRDAQSSGLDDQVLVLSSRCEPISRAPRYLGAFSRGERPLPASSQAWLSSQPPLLTLTVTCQHTAGPQAGMRVRGGTLLKTQFSLDASLTAHSAFLNPTAHLTPAVTCAKTQQRKDQVRCNVKLQPKGARVPAH